MRFKEDVIYTYISSILVSLNPFKQLPIYSPAIMRDYTGRVCIASPSFILSLRCVVKLNSHQPAQYVISLPALSRLDSLAFSLLTFLSDECTRTCLQSSRLRSCPWCLCRPVHEQQGSGQPYVWCVLRPFSSSSSEVLFLQRCCFSTLSSISVCMNAGYCHLW